MEQLFLTQTNVCDINNIKTSFLLFILLQVQLVNVVKRDKALLATLVLLVRLDHQELVVPREH